MNRQNINGINGRPLAVNGPDGHGNGTSGLMLPEVRDGRVDARSVHEALEVGTPFYLWIKRRVEEFGFEEGRDFFSLNASATSTNLSKSNQGVRMDFLLTLDMAKELAMVERTEVGKRMRRYFIDCEKNLTAVTTGRISAEEAAGRQMESAGAAGLPARILRNLAEVNQGLLTEMERQDTRISDLEARMLPGPEWLTARTYAERHPEVEWNCGKLAKLSYLATHASADLGCAVGRERRGGRQGGERKTFSPAALDAALRPRLARWRRKPAPAGPAPERMNLKFSSL